MSTPDPAGRPRLTSPARFLAGHDDPSLRAPLYGRGGRHRAAAARRLLLWLLPARRVKIRRGQR